MPKLKVLCLHGYRQNETTFRERTGALRKLLKKHIDFVFISAPHEIPEPVNLSRPEEERERGWWFSRAGRSYNAMDTTDFCIGYEESLQVVKEMFETQGPFDGLLGFSQGAAFVSLVNLTARPRFTHQVQICHLDCRVQVPGVTTRRLVQRRT